MEGVEVRRGAAGRGIRRAERFAGGQTALLPPRAEDYEAPRTATVGNADAVAREVLANLEGGKRRKKERRRAYKRLAGMVPALVAEIRVQRLVLRDLRGAIERGEEMGRYVERIRDMLPVPAGEWPRFGSVEEMPELWARGLGELPR